MQISQIFTWEQHQNFSFWWLLVLNVFFLRSSSPHVFYSLEMKYGLIRIIRFSFRSRQTGKVIFWSLCLYYYVITWTCWYGCQVLTYIKIIYLHTTFFKIKVYWKCFVTLVHTMTRYNYCRLVQCSA